jgi:cysteinyl-tRNA synthetase
MHTGALTVDGKKMSKSVGNFITIRDFLATHPAAVLRWFALSHHYRSTLDYSERAIAQSISELETIYTLALQAREEAQNKSENVSKKDIAPWIAHFDAALDDDLNTPKAVAVIFEILKDQALTAAAKHALMQVFDGLLGLGIEQAIATMEAIPAKIMEKFEEYRDLRSNKQFIQSDALRKEIEGLGYVVRDTAEGSFITKKFF